MLGLIWAQDADGVIGRDGGIPWSLPEDLQHFKATTRGAAVVMGRATWESLPASVRPLPGRRNVVLSRTPGYDAPGADVVADLPTAFATVAGADVWVIGGGAVYAEALRMADIVVVTDVDTRVVTDDETRTGASGHLTRAPALDDAWVPSRIDPATGWHTSSTGLRYRVRTLVRRVTDTTTDTMTDTTTRTR